MIQIRRTFVQRALAPGANLSALCREFSITRKTGRQWRERARRQGLAALSNRSRRPLHSPQRLAEEDLCHLVSLRIAWPTWGPKKLSQLFRESVGQPLSVSTCHRLLKACHLIKTRKMRVRRAVSAVMAAVVAKAPNQVWTVDFKGWWRTRDGRRCEPLTVRDAYSRFVLSAHVPANSKTQSVHAEFVRLFRQYGLPQVIKSDNGAPFAIGTTPLGLTKLSAYWVALGIQLEHSRPAHPQDNGAHERLHRDMEVEVAAHVQRDAATQQAALDVWREDFNQIRPHEHLGGQRPADLYHVSPRAWPGEDLSLDYGPGFLPRLVTSTGTIRFRGRLIFITTAVAGWHVGLRIIAADLAEVWFNYVRLGTLDLKTHRFGFAPSRSAKAVGLAA